MTWKPKVQMAWVLCILCILTLINFKSLFLVDRFILILAELLALEFLFWKMRGVNPFIPAAGIVTSCIIFLLADTEASFLQISVAIFVAVALKQFLRPKMSHVFNPAGSGLFVASLLGSPVTWWGVSWGFLPLLYTIALAGYLSFFVTRQGFTVMAFIFVSSLVSVFYLGQLGLAVSQFIVGSFWFFALVMLPEPMTSAHTKLGKLLYGSFVAFLPFLFLYFVLPLESLLAPLLIGNLSIRLLEDYKVVK